MHDSGSTFVNLFNKPIASCSIMAISSDESEPINMAGILVREDQKNELNLLDMKRFLLIHAYNFKVKSSGLKLKEWTVNEGIRVDIIERFVGYWKVWRFDKNYERVIQSLIYCSPYYKIYCYTVYHNYQNYDKQVCIPSITKIGSPSIETLCLISYEDKGADMLGNIMLEIPTESGILKGVMALPIKDKKNPIPQVRAVILQKQDGLELFDDNGELRKTGKSNNLNDYLKIYAKPDDIKQEVNKKKSKGIKLHDLSELYKNDDFREVYKKLVVLEQKNTAPLDSDIFDLPSSI